MGSRLNIQHCSVSVYVIPDSVTSIGNSAFRDCSSLAEVVIPDSVVTIGDEAFAYCSSLQEVYFNGNTPTAPDNVFGGGTGTVYYLAGTTGWGDTFGGWTTEPFVPQPRIKIERLVMEPNGNGFGFDISYSGGSMVVVEASTNLLDWTPVSTNLLDGGTGSFIDPTSTDSPNRYYRVLVP